MKKVLKNVAKEVAKDQNQKMVMKELKILKKEATDMIIARQENSSNALSNCLKLSKKLGGRQKI
eukprot:5467287-Amphidinium_carterae.1